MKLTKQEIETIVQTIALGGIVAMPSDTVFGLLCSAFNPEAVARIHALKQRDGKPGTIIAGSIEQLSSLGFDQEQLTNAAKFWPAPVSVVLPAGEDTRYLHFGLDSLAVRIPEPQWLRDLLEKTGPLATSSANLAGQPTVQTTEDARKLFGDAVDLYIDATLSGNLKPSRIVKIHEDGTLEYLR